jgi:hypothetical protein
MTCTQVKEDEMGTTCSRREVKRNAYKARNIETTRNLRRKLKK